MNKIDIMLAVKIDVGNLIIMVIFEFCLKLLTIDIHFSIKYTHLVYLHSILTIYNF